MVCSGDVEMDEEVCFDNHKDEAAYWKRIAEEYMRKVHEVREELQEYQESSRELEAELEAQLEQYEQRVADLLNSKCRLEEELEVFKEKVVNSERENYMQATHLQTENVELKIVREEMTKYIRQLEQTNDDLERSKRATICSMEDFDLRLNNAIEKNVFLEKELEEKEELMVAMQRLKDETRDLKGDLAVASKTTPSIANSTHTPHPNVSSHSLLLIQSSLSPKLMSSTQHPAETARSTTTPQADRHSINTRGMFASKITPFTGSHGKQVSRISALNIVSDLISKVGALETKLSNCRTFVHDHPRREGRRAVYEPPIYVNGNIIKMGNTDWH